jgi:hypothetical protein
MIRDSLSHQKQEIASFLHLNNSFLGSQGQTCPCPPPVFSSRYRITIDTEGQASEPFGCARPKASLARPSVPPLVQEPNPPSSPLKLRGERGGLSLHRPNRFSGGCLSLKGGEGIHVMAGLDPGYLNAGLTKPRRRFTRVAGKKKLRVGKQTHPGPTRVSSPLPERIPEEASWTISF